MPPNPTGEGSSTPGDEAAAPSSSEAVAGLRTMRGSLQQKRNELLNQLAAVEQQISMVASAASSQPR